jgi:hypothetical protein
MIYCTDQYIGYRLKKDLNLTQSYNGMQRLVVTDNKGRLVGQNHSSEKVELLLAGGSWAEGYFQDWDHTIAGNLDKKINGRNVASIGVNGYNLIQIVRRIQQELEFNKVKNIIILYDNIHIDLSARRLCNKILSRPVIIDSLFGYKHIEPKNLKKSIIRLYYNHKCQYDKTSDQSYKYLMNTVELLSKIINGSIWYKFKAFFLGKKYTKSMLGESGENLDYRKYVLDFCMEQLESAAVNHECKIHMFANPLIYGKSNIGSAKFDEKYFNDNHYSRVKYYSNVNHGMTVLWRDYLKSIGFKYNNSFRALLDSDGRHPNKLGYKLMSEYIKSTLLSLK